MHLIFERSEGKFKSNCNILALAWMPYYNENKFRQALFDYHQRQLIGLTSSIAGVNGAASEQHLGYRPFSGARRDLLGGAGNSSANASSSQQNNNEQAAIVQDRVQQRQNGGKFLNSRIAELHQRYVYLKSSIRPTGGNSREPEDRSSVLRKSCSASSTWSELDSRYGRMPEFGWLVVGNVAKIVGITLTSVVAPPHEPDIVSARTNSDERNQDEDLMKFSDETVEQTSSAEACQENHPCNTTETLMQSQTSISAADFEQIRPDKRSIRSNYNLRGHLDEVILVKWNELYQKLATIDSKGNVLIWYKVNEKFTIQTPFYNRTKSVADFKWSNDGKTALICYTDSFILVGSSSGQRHWHSMLNLDDYHITCASWTPNDEQLLLGVSNGNVVVIDLPRSELTELVVNQINIRTMCWSSCEMNLKDVQESAGSIDYNSSAQTNESKNREVRPTSARRNSTIVNHRRLSRDCSVFSRMRFCSHQSQQLGAPEPMQDGSGLENELPPRAQRGISPEGERGKHRNILAIDFANNTIKLYDGGLDDPVPKTIHLNQESYLMQWSSDGQVLAVAGFNIHTTAPSVGCLRCRYLNAIKFFSQKGQLIYEHTLKYTRYPITALTWAHDDQRLFVATGPRLHCAKVFFGVAPLSLLAASCFQRHTRLADKRDLLELLIRGHQKHQHFSSTLAKWQSYNCPIKLDCLAYNKQDAPAQALGEHCSGIQQTPAKKLTSSNNGNVFQFQLPLKLQVRVDDLFAQTIRQPFDEQWSLNDIIWHVPKYNQRYYCTLICYTSEREISSTGYHHQRHDLLNVDMNQASDQYKIFVLYVEFQGSLIPILRARRVGFLKPEFVIFDPDDNQLSKAQRKVSDVAQCQSSFLQSLIQRRLAEQQPNVSNIAAANVDEDFRPTMPSSSPFYYNDVFVDNCSDLHLYSEARASSSSTGRQSLSDAENYYNFDCDTDNRQNQGRFAELISSRSHHQEPVALPLSGDPYLLYQTGLRASGSNQPHTPCPGSSHLNSGWSDQRNSKRGPINFSPTTNLSTYQSRRSKHAHKSTFKSTNLTPSNLTESNELIRIKSNIWGTRFKLISLGNQMIKHPSILGCVTYKASILHLQPRQIILNVKDMSNYCCLCSRHHHTRKMTHSSRAQQLLSDKCAHLKESNRFDGDAKFSLLDLPNVEAHPLKGDRKNLAALKSLNERSKSNIHLAYGAKQSRQNKEEKVLLPVGDSIRVVPKLDRNQTYKFADSTDQQKPSTSSRMHTAKDFGVHNASVSHNLTHRMVNNKPESSRTPNSHSKMSSFIVKAPQYKNLVESETHSINTLSAVSRAHREQDKRESIIFSESSKKRLPATGTGRRIRQRQHFNRADNSSRSTSDLCDENGDDDVLTLSLSQGDQVKVEMSSLRSLNNVKGHEIASMQSNKEQDRNIDEILATNKTLKSIQTITKMIVDLSSKADELLEVAQQEKVPEKWDDIEHASPSKLLKLSTDHEGAPPSISFVAPETPLHRPKRAAPQHRVTLETFAQTQSAHSTPLRQHRSAPKQHKRRASRGESSSEARFLADDLGVLENPLPPPPAAVPIGRRLSSSAKRFIDGSLRSLYGASGTSSSFSASDAEPEENEPLVGRALYQKKFSRDLRRRLIGGGGQSQPCSPMKNLKRQSSDLSSLKLQLMQKLRDSMNKESPALNQKCTSSFGQVDRSAHRQISTKRSHKSCKRATFGPAAGIDSKFCSSDDENSLSDEVSSSSSSAEIYDESASDLEFSNSELEFKSKSSRKASKKSKWFAHRNGNSQSSSVKDLREFACLKLANHKDLNLREQGVENKSRLANQTEQQKQTGQARRRRHQQRRKSVCLNSSCCCAREFKLSNRPPVWNELSQIYQLDFGGRVTQESAKNLQIDFEGNLALQFGRIDRCTYTLDYKYPFNAVQAMAIALASLTQRLK